MAHLNSAEGIQNMCATQIMTKSKSYGAFPLHGTARYGSLLGVFPLGTVPGT